MAYLCQGRIVLATVEDPAGKNPKLRPVVIVTPADEIESVDTLVGVAVTTSFSDPVPENQVPLLWHPQGQSKTRLTRPCVAVCDWLVTIDRASITEMRGVVPPHVLEKIVARLPT